MKAHRILTSERENLHTVLQMIQINSKAVQTFIRFSSGLDFIGIEIEGKTEFTMKKQTR